MERTQWVPTDPVTIQPSMSILHQPAQRVAEDTMQQLWQYADHLKDQPEFAGRDTEAVFQDLYEHYKQAMSKLYVSN